MTDGVFSYERSMEHLVGVIQKLSLARSLDDIMEIVRHAAREISGADGATFVLREGDKCYYADEDAIGPLWKGQKFPLESCISGWAMLNRQHAVIEDIYGDARIPHDAYRPTFVKSLVMMPIRKDAPIGAIGAYWAVHHRASEREVAVLQALADSVSVAMENVGLYATLEQRVQERTAQLEVANKDLESFTYSVSHDLRAPLRSIDGFSRILQDSRSTFDDDGREALQRIRNATQRMNRLIDDLLKLSRVGRAALEPQPLNMTSLANEIVATLKTGAPERKVEWTAPAGVAAHGDLGLLRIALENLLSNAWKFTSKRDDAHVEFGVSGIDAAGDTTTYFVRDNGAGFDNAYADKLFGVFQRLHGQNEFPGTGVGLAIAARVVHRHGGKIWGEGIVGEGATFYFTLPTSGRAPELDP